MAPRRYPVVGGAESTVQAAESAAVVPLPSGSRCQALPMISVRRHSR